MIGKLCTILLATGLLSCSVAASPPQWVQDLTRSAKLGVKTARNEIIERRMQVELDPAHKHTAYHYRTVIRAGGPGKFADVQYPILHAADEDLHTHGTWHICSSGDVTSVPQTALTRNSAFEDYVLYSDEFVSLWNFNNAEVGSFFAFEYSIEFPRLHDYGVLHLQDDAWKVDTTTIEFTTPVTSMLKITPLGFGSQRVFVSEKGVQVGPLDKWEGCPLCGSYEVSATRIQCELYPKENSGQSRRRWTDVSADVAARWKRVNSSLSESYDPRAGKPGPLSVSDLTRRFEQEFRYVAIEIREGRYTPHEPRQVLKMKYGDCKDLSFLLSTLLSLRGITAVPVLVRMPADNPFDPEFPYAFQFNHCIVAIVTPSDTTYYDPTSRDYPFGTLPWEDQGAYALWVKEGSDLTRLPRDNRPLLVSRALQGRLDAKGRLVGVVSLRFDARSSRTSWRNQTDETLKNLIRRVIREDMTLNVAKVSFDDSVCTIRAEVSCGNYARSVGRTLYWKPYPFQSDDVDSVRSDSPQGYYAGRPIHHNDRIEIEIPSDVVPPDALSREHHTAAGLVSLVMRTDSARVMAEWAEENTESWYAPAAKATLDSFFTAVAVDRNMHLRLAPR